jgi:hypothetical protein
MRSDKTALRARIVNGLAARKFRRDTRRAALVAKQQTKLKVYTPD